MKPVRLPAAATLALPRWALYFLGLLYILPGLIGRDLWKDDADSFGIMWTMAHGGVNDYLLPNIAGLPIAAEGPLAFWFGALFIQLFGWLIGDVMAARLSTIAMFVGGAMSVWYTAFHLGRRPEAQPLRLAFGGQPEPDDYGRTLADTAVLIYLGCLGLLLFSHETLAVTLQGSLLAYFLYRAVRYVEHATVRNAVLVGLSLGALALTRGAPTPVVLAATLFVSTRFLDLPSGRTLAHMALAVLVALVISLLWIVPAHLAQPYGQSPVTPWLAWTAGQLALPSWTSIGTFFRVGLWFFWPAWPFAAWAIYAWRRQDHLLHIVLPLFFVGALTLLIICDPRPENGDLLKLLPPLAIMAAFGLPTMKRSTINAIDWFSVLVLTMIAAIVWLFWFARLTGWPAQFAKNVLKLLPGYKPEFDLPAFFVALCVSVGWIFLVHWRVSRRPSVLWRAVVLSSGGLILLWVMLMTLFLPDLNYSKSYASMSGQVAAQLPRAINCLDTNVGAPQRASLAFYGKLRFAGVGQSGKCDYLLLQYSLKSRDERVRGVPAHPSQWQLVWEGKRAADRDERFRLYRRLQTAQ